MIRRLLLVVVLLVTGALLASCTSSGKPSGASASGLNDQSTGGKYMGAGLDPPRPRPSFTLTDTAGKSFAFGTATAGHPTLLYFGYTRCPDACPATMADVGAALSRLPKALAAKTYVVFVITDVKHDTPSVINTWLANFSGGSKAKFIGLRGTQTQIDAAQAAAHVFLASDAGQTHSTQVLLYGVDNYARVAFIQNPANEQKQIEHDLPLVG